jgi:hypothetical protein
VCIAEGAFMTTNLYIEAIAEAQQLKKLAEQNAKNKIIEALTPRIQAMVEAQLLSEQDDLMTIGVEEIESVPEAAPDELVVDDEDETEAQVVVNATGDVNVTVTETKSSLSRESIGQVRSVLNNSQSSRSNKLAERNDQLRRKVRRMDALLEGIEVGSLTAHQRAVIKKSYQKLLGEAVTLRKEVIINSSDKDKRLRLAIFETLKEMNIMTNRRSRAIFNRLFEAGMDEMELVLTDEDLESLGVEDAEAVDAAALDIEIALPAGDEAEAEGEEVAEEEGGEEEVELELEGVNEVYEIDPRMLRQELRKLRALREQEESKAREMDDQFGGGHEELEVMEVDEEDLLNALADELGDPGVPEPKVESRRRRAARRRTTETRRRRGSARTRRTSAPRRSGVTVAENRTLKRQLSEMNLFNAKLLYVNKLMQNRNISSKQQRAIVEALDNAKTIREAKLVYESLVRSLKKRSLSEGSSARKVIGSSSMPTRRASTNSNESAQTDRWATLAGIDND